MPSPIPIHAVRKQAEICLVLLRDLEAAVAQGHPLDQCLAHYYRQHREFGARDRRFFSALAFAWFRWRGWLNTPSQPNALDGVLAWLLDASDMHPAIECLANQLPPFPVPLQAIGTAPINEKARMSGQWLQRPPPAMDALVPSWFTDALFYPCGVDQHEHRHRCIQAFQVRPPTWLRIRTGRERDIRVYRSANARKYDRCHPPRLRHPSGGGDSEKFPSLEGSAKREVGSDLSTHFMDTTLALLKQYNSTATLHPRLPHAICLPDGASSENLKAIPDIEIQDLASQGVGLVCAPGAGEYWWDACAGSGGKSFHLADLMKETGSILATDTRESIRKECQRRLRRNRLRAVTIRPWDGASDPAPGQLFDGVLVDAPCSGIGTWHRNPDARWRTSAEVVSCRADLQSGLLRICAEKVRPGGRLIYAVCTLTHIETMKVIETFLAERKDFHLDPTPHPLTGKSTAGLIWIWPWEGNCNGMFIAATRKTA